MDIYMAVMYKGGVYNKAFGNFYPWSQKLLDSALATPVDCDKDGTLLGEAKKDHQSTLTPETLAYYMKSYPFRDNTGPGGGRFWNGPALYPFIDKINKAGVPAYLTNGWYDLFTLDNFLIYANLTVPKRMIVLATDHSEVESPDSGIDYGVEAHRWFDYWLKGVQNGIMNEPAIHLYIMEAEKKDAWRTNEAWPMRDQETTRYYFGDAVASGNSSVNNGTLFSSPPTVPEVCDTCKVDYSTTTGKKSRWTAVTWTYNYPDMSFNDAKALTYTSPPLEKAVQVIGHPVVHVWLSVDASDLDVFAYLEEVDAKGSSKYITEGNLRVSHRALGEATYDNLGLPYHAHLQSEVKPIPSDEPVELLFDLLPTAYQFSRGKRIRIAITCADSDNFETPILSPAPTLRLLRSASHPSYVEIPEMRSQGSK